MLDTSSSLDKAEAEVGCAVEQFEGDGYNPATFGTAYEAFEAIQEKTDG